MWQIVVVISVVTPRALLCCSKKPLPTTCRADLACLPSCLRARLPAWPYPVFMTDYLIVGRPGGGFTLGPRLAGHAYVCVCTGGKIEIYYHIVVVRRPSQASQVRREGPRKLKSENDKRFSYIKSKLTPTQNANDAQGCHQPMTSLKVDLQKSNKLLYVLIIRSNNHVIIFDRQLEKLKSQ